MFLKKRIGFILPVMAMLLVLTACSGPAAKANSLNNQPSNSGGGSNSSTNTNIQNRLAPGIFMLEGTDQAVTAQQAKQLLPLWQQVQTLDANNTAASSDIQSVYQQIEGVLTTAQIQAIQNLNLSQSSLQSLMTQLGIQFTPSAFGGSRPTISPNERATLTAQGTQVPGNNGFPRGTGTPGAFNGSRNFSGSGTPPVPGQFGNRGLNLEFISPLIQLLQQRAGS